MLLKSLKNLAMNLVTQWISHGGEVQSGWRIKEGESCDPSPLSWEYPYWRDIFTKALGRERIDSLINKWECGVFYRDTLKQLADEVDE
ncbi:hypothetical protein Tco_0520191 [Tanacetum coccineum]